MLCPKCQQDMIVVEHQQIELDYCPVCEGVWFDAGELELFLETAALASPELEIENIIGLPEIKAGAGKRKCPICRQSMKEVSIGMPSIDIDVCRRGDGLWFDGGEVNQLILQLAKEPANTGGSQQRIITFLGDVFKGG